MNLFKKILIGALALFAVVIGLVLILSNETSSATDLPMIHYTEAFDQEPKMMILSICFIGFRQVQT